MRMNLFNKIYCYDSGINKEFYHLCTNNEWGWTISNGKCLNCDEKMPSDTKLNVIRGLKRIVG